MNSTAALDLDPPSLSVVDVATLLVYFAVISSITYLTSRRAAARPANSQAYFLADRSLSAPFVAASLFSSNVGSEHFVGLAGSGAAHGLAVGWYEWGAVPPLLLLGFFLLPVYLSSGIETMPEYVERRFCGPAKAAVVSISLALYVLTKASASLFAGVLILEAVSHLQRYVAVALLVCGTAGYVLVGGLSAVVYTEAVQTVVLLVGGVLVVHFSLDAIGGWGTLTARADTPGHRELLHVFRPASDPDFPWTAFVTGYFVNSVWYWGTDQVIVQRALGARNVAHGRLGTVMAACMKLSVPFLMIVPGMAARVLMERDGILDPNDPHPDPTVLDKSYPWLIGRVLPRHTHGLLIAAVMASLMSSLASVFNSSATIFTLDVYRPVCHPRASERQLLWVGRCSVVAMAALALLWLPVLPALGDQLFVIVQKPPAYLSPGILVCFVCGMFSRSANSAGALAALFVCTLLGMARLVMEVVEAVTDDSEERYSSDHSNLGGFVRMHFLHFAAVNFTVGVVTMFAVSWLYTWRSASAPGKDVSAFVWSRRLYRRMLEARPPQTPVRPPPTPPPGADGLPGLPAHADDGIAMVSLSAAGSAEVVDVSDIDVPGDRHGTYDDDDDDDDDDTAAVAVGVSSPQHHGRVRVPSGSPDSASTAAPTGASEHGMRPSDAKLTMLSNAVVVAMLVGWVALLIEFN